MYLLGGSGGAFYHKLPLFNPNLLHHYTHHPFILCLLFPLCLAHLFRLSLLRNLSSLSQPLPNIQTFSIIIHPRSALNERKHSVPRHPLGRARLLALDVDIKRHLPRVVHFSPRIVVGILHLARFRVGVGIGIQIVRFKHPPRALGGGLGGSFLFVLLPFGFKVLFQLYPSQGNFRVEVQLYCAPCAVVQLPSQGPIVAFAREEDYIALGRCHSGK
jgi:hypothetical protein